MDAFEAHHAFYSFEMFVFHFFLFSNLLVNLILIYLFFVIYVGIQIFSGSYLDCLNPERAVDADMAINVETSACSWQSS